MCRIAPSTGLQAAPPIPGVMVMNGNQALSLGALAAGCRFLAGYPITPATDIMEFMAANLPELGGVVVQAEDEISAMGMVLGASYAGKKAMTSTSGPGFSLMIRDARPLLNGGTALRHRRCPAGRSFHRYADEA